MSLKDLKKEDLELLSNKDITNIILEESGSKNTADLFKEIIKLLDLPKSTFDQKIGDYYIINDRQKIYFTRRWILGFKKSSYFR